MQCHVQLGAGQQAGKGLEWFYKRCDPLCIAEEIAGDQFDMKWIG